MADSTTTRKLVGTLGAEGANNVNVTLYDHRSDLDAETVATTFGEVVALEVLTNADGVLMTDVVGAKENILF